ncbi:hypothetical protein [Sphingosinicella terrae]|uniref:hypothetical protein n=1 Tax=Sphingosinicella terrae TaxID=2172047 RepID=UPI0013B3CD7E|nr:hypothetical protein [Sphingosinicella terrae]
MSSDAEWTGVGGLLAAATVAPIAGSLWFFVAFPDFEAVIEILPIVWLFGFPIALLHAALIGLPAYALLRRRVQPAWWRACLGGSMIGAGPMLLIVPDFGSLLLGATSGFAGGLAFWICVVKLDGSRGTCKSTPKEKGRPVSEPPHR